MLFCFLRKDSAAKPNYWSLQCVSSSEQWKTLVFPSLCQCSFKDALLTRCYFWSQHEWPASRQHGCYQLWLSLEIVFSFCLQSHNSGCVSVCRQGSGCEKVKTETMSLLKGVILTGVWSRIQTGLWDGFIWLNRNLRAFKSFPKVYQNWDLDRFIWN